MILQLYLSLFALAISLLFIGYYGKIDSIKVLGFGIIFLLGAFIFGYGDTLQYRTGDNITIINNQTTTVSYTYATYNNVTIGFMFTVLAFFGWLSVYFDFKSKRRGD